MAICGQIASCRTRVRDRIYNVIFYVYRCFNIQLIVSFGDRSACAPVIVVVVKIYINICILDHSVYYVVEVDRFGTVSVYVWTSISCILSILARNSLLTPSHHKWKYWWSFVTKCQKHSIIYYFSTAYSMILEPYRRKSNKSFPNDSSSLYIYRIH